MLTKHGSWGPCDEAKSAKGLSGILSTSVMLGGGERLALKVGFCKQAVEVQSLR